MKNFSLFKRILLAMLFLAILPLIASSLLLALNLGNVREKLASEITESADRQASESLRLRAEQVAGSISSFLQECEGDLHLLTTLPRSPLALKAFYDSRKGEIWHRSDTSGPAKEVRERIPLYSSLALIDRNGNETFAIRDGRILDAEELRNVSDPARTEFRSEDYFQQARKLRPGEIYVSHLTGFHLLKGEQLGSAAEPEEAVNGSIYRGVVRFATPLADEKGHFAGVAVISLDHRHLMEFSQHINPGQQSATVFPSYKSGNYAFIFDDEGWIITHPKFWDIRGVDRSGRLVPPYKEDSPRADVESGRIPFNLDHAGFIHSNYPTVSRLAREKKSGYVDVTNVGGAKKVMAFAPILYDTGPYRAHGIFGAVTIGFQVDQFHETARAGAAVINDQLKGHLQLSLFIVSLTCIMVVAGAWHISRSITRPLALLTDSARQLASGETGNRVAISGGDEVGELTETFNSMARELEQRKANLMRTLKDLEASRKEIMDERNFKESILESISSAIMTFSPDGTLTSINGTGRRFLGGTATRGTDFTTLFREWDDMAERVALALEGNRKYGREPLTIERKGKVRHFEVGFFPIYEKGSGGITVTMRDETEKEQFREEMTRLDRLASLGKLSAGIAHEVRNPLTGISLLLDDLHDRSTFDPESQAMMGKALAEIERVEKLIAALLNFSTPAKAEFREGDLNRVVQDTLLLLRREAERQGVELDHVPGEIFPFRFDGDKIKQALLNLLKNSLEALPRGGNITVTTSCDGEWAAITISDNGPGIVAADLPLIFEPFFTRKGAGTGLGLAITRQIVEEHHGRISVESSAGKGTTFNLSLPR